MFRHVRRFPVLLALAAAIGAGPALAQPVPAAPDPASSSAFLNGLWQYEGTYEYEDERTIEVLAHQGELYAVIDEAKYRLTHKGGDVFLNPAGGEVTFYRLGPLIRGLKQGTVSFERKTRLIRPESRDLLSPRPARFWKPDRVYRYEAPRDLDDGIGMGQASASTLPPETVERIVRGVEDGAYADVHSVLVSRGDRLVMEEYFYGYDRERPHQMRQLTQGVLALTAGAAIEARILPGEQTTVAPYLRYRDRRREDPRRERITLAHLLSMRSGVDCADDDRSAAVNALTLYTSEDWIKAFVQAPMAREPGTAGPRCAAGPLVVGRMIELSARKRLREVAEEVLFRRLGFKEGEWRWPFVLTRAQAHEYGQVWLTPRQMLKIGLVLKDDGRWLGKPLVREEWVQAMTAPHGVVDGEPYGYGVRLRAFDVRTDAGPLRVQSILLSGDGGQNIWIVRELDLVMVTTGGAYNQPNAAADAMLADVILPAILQADPSARERLGQAR